MKYSVIRGVPVVRALDEPIAGAAAAMELTASLRYETDCEKMVLSKVCLDESFFRLSSGLAGEVLQKFVKENHLDVGFAYDGDADRCIAVDDKGEEINGDLILYVCGKYMKEQGKLNNNTIVTTIMSNLGLYKACDREGISYEKTAVGDKYVCENMMQNGHSIGGEQSGHIIFSKHATTGDGILTSLKIMEVIIEKKLPLSTLASEVKIYPQVLKNVRVYDKKEARENPEVVKVIKKVEEALGEDGRILVRESGTEPVVRVMVEASTDEICNQYVDEVIAVMRAQNLVQ